MCMEVYLNLSFAKERKSFLKLFCGLKNNMTVYNHIFTSILTCDFRNSCDQTKIFCSFDRETCHGVAYLRCMEHGDLLCFSDTEGYCPICGNEMERKTFGPNF